MLKVYTYAKCSTCRAAVAWLRSHDLEFTEVPIRETPPTRAEFTTMLAAYGGNLKRLFNSSGQDYRELKLSERLPDLSLDESLAILGSRGNLVKRPFLIGAKVALVGFDPSAWSEVLLGKGSSRGPGRR